MARGAQGDDPNERFASYRNDPVGFARDILGQSLWEFQRTALERLVSERFVTIRSCHKSGKTHLFAVAGVWAMCTAPSIVIPVMPVEQQLKDIYFGTVRELHARARVTLPGQVDMLQWRLGPRHYMQGLSTRSMHSAHGRHTGVRVPEDPDRDLTEEELAQIAKDIEVGASSEVRVLLIFDEAPNIPQYVLDGFRGTMASPFVYGLMAGNPVIDFAEEHEYPRSHHTGSRWFRIKVSAYEAPDPVDADLVFDKGYGEGGKYGVPNWLLDRQWIESQELECGGKDTPLYLGKVLGQFSRAVGDDVVITFEMLEAALEGEGSKGIGPRMGVDVARSRDRCVASLFFDGRKIGQKIWRPERWDEQALMTVASTITAQARKWGQDLKAQGFDWDGRPIPAKRISMDATGMGAGVADRLAQMGWRVDRVDFGAKPSRHYRLLQGDLEFANERARMHWTARRLLQEGQALIPRRWKLSWQEAQWARCEFRASRGGTEFWVEPKKTMLRRSGRSPDVWDADLLAMTRETASEAPLIRAVGGGRRRGRGSGARAGRRRPET